jgi:DNA-binding winged helix-turn-helix (wHTH) protein/TolB-like protein
METAENKEVVYEFGRFLLDPKQKILRVDGRPLHLPAKEFDTLLLLVQNNGRALSKEEMMSAVWQDSFVEEGNLAKQISRLRKILNTGGSEFIETIPKHGYRFTADLRMTAPEAEGPIIIEKRTVKRVTIAVEDQDEPLALPAGSGSRLIPRAAIAALTAAVVIAGVILWQRWNRDPAERIGSIAVLPLRPLSDDPDAKVLGLGLTDALIVKLGSLRKVNVRPIGAVTALQDNSNSVEAARTLGVDAVLEGTIQKDGGRLRVTARLVRAVTGEQIWADRFEQQSAGLFALQDALSASIAKALAFELSKADSDTLLRRGTENPEAYEKYLRGRFYQTHNTAEGLSRSIELYEQAVALDPNFAEAHAGIADANVIMFNFNLRTGGEAIPRAREELGRALRLDPELSNAYTALALIQFLADQNWPEAEKSLQRAIELNPSNADAYHRYGYFLLRLGHFDEALEKNGKALELNPLSVISRSNRGLIFLCARKYPEAIEELEKVTAENPRFSFPQWLLGLSYEGAGDGEKAFEANLKALELEDGAELVAVLRKYKEENGLDAANMFWLDETVKSRKDQIVPALTIAGRAATVKDRERTLFWLEKALEEADTTLGGTRFFAKYDFVRDDPRFHAVVNRLAF